MKRVVSLLGALLAFGLTAANAQEQLPLPEGTKPVTTAELKAWFDRGEAFTLVNSLSPLEFTQTKIKGSINIPYDNLLAGEASLPADKERALVFYCLGPK